MVKIIFLIGHRKQHSKDSCCDIIEKQLNDINISFFRTSFAAKLKKHCAERYDLNAKQMEFDDYKKSKPLHLNGLSVRDVLIQEGTFSRKIWNNVWTSTAYRDIFNSGATVGLISDFRYPNEYSCFEETFRSWAMSTDFPNAVTPTIIRVLAHRENGVFISDGSDDQLPDLSPYWDEIVLNNIEGRNWYQHIGAQVLPMVTRNLNKYVFDSIEGNG